MGVISAAARATSVATRSEMMGQRGPYAHAGEPTTSMPDVPTDCVWSAHRQREKVGKNKVRRPGFRSFADRVEGRRREGHGMTNPRASRSPARSVKLSRDVIVNAALTFLDREGWDALTINAPPTSSGTRARRSTTTFTALDDLRRTVRMRVIDDIPQMLSAVAQGRTRDDAVMAMASAYRSYAHHHPGRYSAFTRMPLGGDDPGSTRPLLMRRPHRSSKCCRPTGCRARARSMRPWVLGGVARFCTARDDGRHGRGRHGRGVFRTWCSDWRRVWLIAQRVERRGDSDGSVADPGPEQSRDLQVRRDPASLEGTAQPGIVDSCACSIGARAAAKRGKHARTAGQFIIVSIEKCRELPTWFLGVEMHAITPGRGVSGRAETAVQRLEEDDTG